VDFSFDQNSNGRADQQDEDDDELEENIRE
jgi:hypothetical protein